MRDEFGAAILAVVIVVAAVAALLAGYHPPRTCPPGTFPAMDGFCTHIYTTPPPGTPSAAHPRR